MLHPALAAHFERFTAAVLDRMHRGAAEYGDRSLDLDPDRLVAEIREELADVCGWAVILDYRLARIQTAAVRFRSAIAENREALAAMFEQAGRLADEEQP